MVVKKFEEWDKEKKEVFIKSFASKYNDMNKTDFQLWPRWDNAKDDFDCCLKSDSGGKLLKIQHRYGDLEEEFQEDSHKQKLLSELRINVRDFRNIFIGMSFKKVPANEIERKEFTDFLKFLLILNLDKTPTIFSFNEDNDDYLKHLRPFISSLYLLPIENGRLAYGITGKGGFTISEDVKVNKAVTEKERKYASPHDLILMIHFHLSPVSNFYIGPIIEEQKDRKFKEIWLYDEWEKSFIKVK